MTTPTFTIGTANLYGPIDTEADETEDGVFNASLVWRIHETDKDTAPELLTADQVAGPFIAVGALPQRGTRYQNTRATCRSTSAKKESNFVYLFTAKYSSKNSTDEEKATDENPLFDRPIITWTGSTESRAIYKDRDDKPILNTAGDPIIDTIDDNVIGATVKSNVAFLPAYILTYRNATNHAEFSLGGLTISENAARFVLPGNFISEIKYRNEIPYYEFTYELKFDEQDLHYGKLLNAGFREKVDKFFGDGVNDFLRNITNSDGTEISEPAPLDTDGAKIALPTPENSVFVEVKKYYVKDFSVLPGVVT